MLVFFLVILILLLAVALIAALYYLIKFARIIFSIEDRLENALETLSTVHGSIVSLLEMKMFFESKEVKMAADHALAGVRLSKVAMIELINDFTRLSKEKYITINAEEDGEEGFDEKEV
jgi:hypothetical protein